MTRAAVQKRGGDAHVPTTPKPDDAAGRQTSHRAERALEQGLEESMEGSDPPSIVQPGKNFSDSK